MQTPKEKAIELVNKFKPLFPVMVANKKGKEAAIIALDEILGHCPMAPVIQNVYYESASDRIDAAIDFWLKTKDEISKL